MAELILTNGDSAADLLAAAGKSGRILPWRDVLHEGPIVAGDLEACSARRVAYLAERFALDRAEIAADFAERDAAMRAHNGFDKIELWFEHDLYDQLQLIQILAFLAEVDRVNGVSLIQSDVFLGTQKASTILRLADRARPIDREDLSLARQVWGDLAAAEPKWVLRRLADPDDRLPFLRPALRRFLEELPAPGIGLGRTEATLLVGIAGGISEPARLFRSVLAAEEAAFMGDTSFFSLIDDLAICSEPLITGVEPPDSGNDDRYGAASLDVTPFGAAVARGTEDHVRVNGIDRWWGGTRLQGHAVWRYDPESMTLVPPAAGGA